MGEAASKKSPERLKESVKDSQAAAKELIKDAAALKRQAAVLREISAEARAEAREIRAKTPLTAAPALLTIPEAAHCLHVSERSLRHLLLEPCWHERLVERNHKVGIYYKFISLLPPDMVADLTLHFASRKPQGQG